MFMLRSPSDAYDRVALDARIAGSDARQLTGVCLDHAIESLGRALAADRAGSVSKRSQALGLCLNALSALTLGIDRQHPMAATLSDFYEGVRTCVAQAVRSFSRETVERARGDLVDVATAMTAAQA